MEANSYTVNGITYDTTKYTVTVEVTRDETTKKLSAVVAVNGEEGAEAEFSNCFTAETSITFHADKILTGSRAAGIGKDEFRFVITENGTEVATGTTAAGTSVAEIVFDEIKYVISEYMDQDDYDAVVTTHTYTVSEVQGTDTSIDYSEAVFTVTVEVTENNGVLSAEITEIKDAKGTSLNLEEGAVPEFANTYLATGYGSISGTKTLTGNRAKALQADEFEFAVVNTVSNEIVGTAKNLADGTFEVTFGKDVVDGEVVPFDQDDIGETFKTYKLIEVSGTDTSITYSDSEYDLTVEVADGEKSDGNLAVTVTLTDADETAEFINHYNASGSANLTAGKVLEGNRAKAIQDGEFTFTAACVSADGSQAGKTYNGRYDAATGQVVFDTMDFDENDIGATYVFALSEAVGENSSIEYSEETFYASVTISDSGEIGTDGKGILNADVKYYEDPECLYEMEKVTFTNKYRAEGSLVIDNVQKVMDQADLEAEEFTFELKDAEGNLIAEAKNDASGKVTFPEIQYTEADINKEFTYTVSEKNTGTEGIVYDETIYTVIVKVEDGENSDGTLKITETIQGEENPEVMTFTNRFNGSVRLTKTDGNTKFLAGAQFQLLAEQEDGTYAVYSSAVSANGLYETDENGVLEVTNLPEGNYYFVETRAPKGYVITTDDQGQPVKYSFRVAPGEETAAAELTVTNESGTEGSISVTKRTTMFDGDIVDVAMKDATFYVGIFTDSEGTQPYGTDYVKEIHMNGQSVSETVVFSGLETGTYYILETDAQGNPIPLDTLQTDGDKSFTCMVDGDGTNMVELDLAADKVEGAVNLNNLYYQLPDGYYMEGQISITKNVLVGGERSTVDDVFYAGIFTEDGTLVRVIELTQNGTVTVPVSLGGENGTDPITYYVRETDASGTPVNYETFAYSVSGEGTVALNVNNTSASITITNELVEEEEETEITTETTTSEKTETTGKNTTSGGVKTGDNTPIGMYLMLLAASAAVIAGLFIRRRRRNDA